MTQAYWYKYQYQVQNPTKEKLKQIHRVAHCYQSNRHKNGWTSVFCSAIRSRVNLFDVSQHILIFIFFYS